MEGRMLMLVNIKKMPIQKENGVVKLERDISAIFRHCDFDTIVVDNDSKDEENADI